LNPRVTRHLELFAGDRITGKVNQTTRDALASTLLEGVRAGEGIRELKARVGDVFATASGSRAELIARTEVMRSSNFGTLEAFAQSGVVEKKQWVSTRDDVTRDTHVELDGQVRAIDEDFEVDGKNAPHPGGFGLPEEDIACRCTVIAVIEDPKDASGLDAAWKVFDRKLRPWERQAKRALKRGFGKQKADMIEALEEHLAD
jgi:SPP1 gp7 family putative phage head morphogenesis protein